MLSVGLNILFSSSVFSGLASLILNSSLCWVFARRPNLQSPSNMFTLAICIVETVLGALFVTSGIQGLVYGKYPREPTYCVIEGFLVQTLCSISVLGVSLPCVYLFYRIVLMRPDISILSVWLSILVSWTSISVIMALPLFLSTNPYSMNSSGAWCGINLLNPEVLVRMIVWMDVLLGIGIPTLMILLFYLIFKKVTVRKNAARVETMDAKTAKTKKQENTVIDCLVKKAFWGVFFFCFCWGPMLVINYLARFRFSIVPSLMNTLMKHLTSLLRLCAAITELCMQRHAYILTID
jgi:hypothetical protein